MHPFFDELRDPATKMSDGSPMPHTLFAFTTEELQLAPELADRLVPAYLAGTIPLPPLDMDAAVASSSHTPAGLA